MSDLARDLVGYGPNPPDPQWPGGARLAVNFVLNYEEGSEYSIANGDGRSEVTLTEIPASPVPAGERDLAAESMFEYGSRVGFWRIMRVFAERQLPMTIFGCALALERNPAAAQAIVAAGHDICCHGWRWVEHFKLGEAEERHHIRRAIESLEHTVGQRPLGWYCRYGPSVNTRRLVVEEGGFLYDSDAYNDDLPYYVRENGRPHLVVPYTLTNNDMKYGTNGFGTGEDFFTYCREAFDFMYAEGESQPKMMSIGMHMRLLGHPGRASGLARLLDHMQSRSDVWICRRLEIARHWLAQHPPAA
ncbi:MAG TPA: allantoinase PuuE [Geminicoccaceae bacterium]|nr:allantoinase PuuE [Geminicoccaceae bacterium]